MVSAFKETGVYPFNPEVPLAKLPEIYPPPRQEKGRKSSLADVASYVESAPTYAQRQYVKEAREVGRREVLEEVNSLLAAATADAESNIEVVQKLKEITVKISDLQEPV
jgi:hypothetical protein